MVRYLKITLNMIVNFNCLSRLNLLVYKCWFLLWFWGKINCWFFVTWSFYKSRCMQIRENETAAYFKFCAVFSSFKPLYMPI